MRYSLNQARLTVVGVAILDPSVDVLDWVPMNRRIVRLDLPYY
jgi:hypothetical protein